MLFSVESGLIVCDLLQLKGVIGRLDPYCGIGSLTDIGEMLIIASKMDITITV
jgi:hypothetical protein